MAKINIGAAHDNSRMSLKAELSVASVMELNVGDGDGMSQREIEIIERESGQLASELTRLRQQVADMQASPAATPATPAAAAVCAHASAIAEAAGNMVADRKWYSISAAGLVEAAKAVGAAASPMVDTALKVLDLLNKVRAAA